MQRQDREETTKGRHWSWLSLARIGAGGFVVWAITLQLGAGFVDPIITTLGVVYAVSIGLLERNRRGRLVGFTVFAALTMIPNIVFGSSDLRHLDSAGSFIPQLFVTLCIGLAILGGAGELRGRSTAMARTVLGRVAIVFATGVAVSLVVSTTAPSDRPLADDVAVDAVGFAWEPDVISYDAATASGLWVDNRDFAHHTFAVPDLGIEVQLPASKSRRVELGDVAAGEYHIVCTIPGHEQMTGTLVVAG